MGDRRFERVRQLFGEALPGDTTQRQLVLARAADEDPTLAAEVAALLEAHEAAQGFLGSPALEGGLGLDEAQDPLVGQQLGPYLIEGEVGRGGMGRVYRAMRSDGQYQQRVAIKLVHAGLARESQERFHAERRILARLEHPAIARLLDAGTAPDGRPFLVMEYVEGQRLDRCVAERQLGLRQRLELFRAVCAGVQSAHRNLVVHRDLKPANILVTSEGQPKLLDFGIARLLDPETGDQRTATLARALTPDYASPEQVRGEPATTSSDVYSLGVLLFELLTGQRPYQAAGLPYEELARTVCERLPARPSSLLPAGAGPGGIRRRDLSGDLDTIVLAALHKEPARRYSSVEALSEDVRRYLAGLPVLARADTLAYRSLKFVRRHRAGVAAAALLALSLLGGLAATTWQARRARAQQARAEQRFNDVRQLANSFLFDFHDAIADIPGTTRARELVVKTALGYLEGLSREASGDAGLQLELALAYKRIGEIQSRPGAASLGDSAGALKSYDAAEALLLPLQAGPSSARATRALAHLYLLRGNARHLRGEHTSALDDYRAALRAQEARRRSSPHDRDAVYGSVEARLQVGNGLLEGGDVAAALDQHREAVRLAEPLAAGSPGEDAYRKALARGRLALAESLRYAGAFAEALEQVEAATALRRASLAADPTSVRARRGLALCHGRAGDLELILGRPAGALANYQEALRVALEQSSADADNAAARLDASLNQCRVCQALLELRRNAEAERHCREALRLALELRRADPSAANEMEVAFGHYWVGKLLQARGARAAAREHFLEDLRIGETIAAQEHSGDAQAGLAESYANMGAALAQAGESAQSAAFYAKALALLEPLAAAQPLNYLNGLALADVHMGQARLLAGARPGGRGNPAPAAAQGACDHYLAATRQFEALNARQPLPTPKARALAEARTALGRCGRDSS